MSGRQPHRLPNPHPHLRLFHHSAVQGFLCASQSYHAYPNHILTICTSYATPNQIQQTCIQSDKPWPSSGKLMVAYMLTNSNSKCHTRSFGFLSWAKFLPDDGLILFNCILLTSYSIDVSRPGLPPHLQDLLQLCMAPQGQVLLVSRWCHYRCCCGCDCPCVQGAAFKA